MNPIEHLSRESLDRTRDQTVPMQHPRLHPQEGSDKAQASALRAPAEGAKGTAASYQRHSEERQQSTRPLFPKRRKGWGICFARMKINNTVILSVAIRFES